LKKTLFFVIEENENHVFLKKNHCFLFTTKCCVICKLNFALGLFMYNCGSQLHEHKI